jgi:hypothetical protein
MLAGQATGKSLAFIDSMGDLIAWDFQYAFFYPANEAYYP